CCALMPVTRAAGGARVTGSEAPHEDTGTYRLMAREAAHLRSVGAWFVRRWPNTEPVAASSLALVAMAANPPQRRAASTTPYSCSLNRTGFIGDLVIREAPAWASRLLRAKRPPRSRPVAASRWARVASGD